MLTEMKVEEIINKNQCPAEYARQLGYAVTVDCEKSGYDCRVCVADVVERDRYRK